MATQGSVVSVADSAISNSSSFGLVVSQGSSGMMTNSSVSGAGTGLSVTDKSEFTIVNSKVSGMEHGVGAGGGGDGWGLGVHGGVANVMQGSEILGLENGVFFTHGHIGSEISAHGTAVVDGSKIEALNGSVIKVESYSGVSAFADITIQNGSTLVSGNGNLLEVEKASTANFTVDNSTLTGNLVADDTSTLNVVLKNNASLTGDITNGNNLAVNSGAQWQMVGDNSVKSLSLGGGQVRFGLDGFHTLSLGELSGSGVFGMKIDLDAGVGDLLSVNGQANGDFTLKVKNTGTEPVSPDLQPLQIVHTEGGDAQFNLLGERVDLGAYSYELEKQGDDWFIVGSGKTISPSTQSALALFNAAPTIFMSEMTTLRSRMGEVRGSGEGGGWMRAYGSRFEATTGAGVGYKQQQRGLSFGADAPVPVSNGQMLLGVLGGYSKSDLDLNRGTSGTVDSYYVGAYGTWLSEEGYYVDAVLKLNKFRNESKVAMSDQTKAQGDYNNLAVGGSVEVGKHIKLGDDYFIEPFAQMEAVVVQGDHYRLDNGLDAKNDRTQSVLGKVGSSVGRNIALKDGGVLQPYLRAAVAHEFARSNKVTVNDTRFDNDLFGSRAELGVGVAVSLSKNLQVHADFDYMKGNNVEQPWGANVGVRLAF
ncbi:autotransporter outer membrane beta-barrel domain-containing protein [Pseudomonas sp. MH10]|uniref:autotransporter outer membrane beta-barrel domain-containing protein n=2 Tax=Pseudomonas sp. MH10 TaxID=3048627 RepID=UPI003A100578